MTFTPTDEQLAIVAAARDTTDNLLISALAGAAKTSTLELIAQALPDVNIICLAFNKSIATEMKSRLPDNCQCQTLNSLGHQVWSAHIGKRLSLKTSKTYGLVSDYIKAMPKAEQEAGYASMSFVMQSIGQLKSAGWLPKEFLAKHPKATAILDDDEAETSLESIATDLEWEMIYNCYTESCAQALDGIIDFGDQVLMSSCFPCMYPIYSLILVDESQDLSPLNHQMLQKLYRRRIIAVGDQCQAIYAFRGASLDGMNALKQQFDMTELSLSCSFRCPPRIVEEARWRAPHMTAWEGNPNEGEVKSITMWSPVQIPDDAAVICRNNAPLFSVAIDLLRSGRHPKIWGKDLSAGLLKTMKKLGPESLASDDALEALDHYEDKELKRARNKGTVRDRCSCIRIFLRSEETLGAAITYMEYVFRSSGTVNFMTGHKAKGHEFSHVFILDEELMANEGQDLNLRYVMQTRSKNKLVYITSDGMAGQDDDQMDFDAV